MKGIGNFRDNYTADKPSSAITCNFVVREETSTQAVEARAGEPGGRRKCYLDCAIVERSIAPEQEEW
jgi:hypothetical protein